MNYKEIINLIKKARKKKLESENLEQKIFTIFNNNNIDLTSYSGGCNSDNLEEMICCYIQYGEDDIEELTKRIKEVF